MAESPRNDQIERARSREKMRAIFAIVVIAAGGVWLERSGDVKALIDRVVPPPKAVEPRFLPPNSPPSDSPAERLLFAAGLARAKRESKRVFFHASGTECHPCFLLGRFLEENQALRNRLA